MKKKSVRRKVHAHLSLSHILLTIFCIPLILLVLFLSWLFLQSEKTDSRQAKLQPFYEISNIPSAKPGTLIRQQFMDIVVPGGGKAYRILYHSELADGTPTIVSGMIFIPTKPPTSDDLFRGSAIGERPIIAWAHGTIGMGTSCAPSRSLKPLSDIGGLSEMMASGFIVVATDYYGLGTEGVEHYLIGQDEARDVLNSVRAARGFPQTQTSDRFALWGHSQGGHSVLFAANLAKEYAPELTLIAAAAGAPAAELPSLMHQSYKTAVPWVIGPEIAIAWPLVYKDLPLEGVLSPTALKNYERLGAECSKPAGIEAIIRSKFDERFFAVDPTANPLWKQALTDQTPEPVMGTPLLIVQGLADTIVLPNTTALFAKKSCDEGTNLTMNWLADVTHLQTAIIAGPSVASWLEQRFESLPAESNCDQPLPVSPAEEV